ncbi:hypothetical protein EKE94_05320 [Mesobaculum littorinae]|uniref:Uncharacterized protein n=1 Tax=Mesobaculum littorinae TaxID=2486419 RepID=A0A438AHY9_9RHOB|nr:hypothetical protein [Mesobaculum littorinae]RVV98346.1 hypothetical protein EKE94_05320 [Mesobaculum littorinae]
MSLLRPEARAALIRWRETLTGLATVALGAWWMTGPRGLLFWVGAVVVLAGAALAVTGTLRARFRAVSGGAGVVEVVEGQLAYFGPDHGGVIDLGAITALWRVPGGWRIEAGQAQPLLVPLGATGGEALFDACTRLPGFSSAAMLRAQQMQRDLPHRVWARPDGPRDAPRMPGVGRNGAGDTAGDGAGAGAPGALTSRAGPSTTSRN